MIKFKKYILLSISASILSIFNTIPGALPAYSAYAAAEDYTISEAYWGSSVNRAMAYWGEAESKTSYKIQLYKGTKKIGNLITTSSASYNFTTQIIKNGTGSYSFKIYPSKGNKNTQTITSDILPVDTDYLNAMKKAEEPATNHSSTAYASTAANSTSASQNTAVSTSANQSTNSATSASNAPKGPGVNLSQTQAQTISQIPLNLAQMTFGWNLQNDNWYFKKSDDSLTKGEWLLTGQKYYYFEEDRTMQKGWLRLKNLWYYLDPINGDMQTGWKEIGGKWYYFNHPNGDLAVNTVIDGWKVNENGEWIP